MTTWQKIFENAGKTTYNTSVAGKKLSKEDVLENLGFIRKYFGEDYEPNSKLHPQLASWLEQIKIAPNDTIAGTRYIYHLANAIRAVEKVKGGKDLLGKIKSHEGMVVQLLITHYFLNTGFVSGVEEMIKDYDVDIAFDVKGQPLMGQVKKIDQEDKLVAHLAALHFINEALRKKGSPLRVNAIVGIVPTKSQDEWNELPESVSDTPQKTSFSFPNKGGKTDDFTLEFVPEADAQRGTVGGGISPLYRLPNILDIFRVKAATLPDKDTSFFIGIVPYEIQEKFVFEEKYLNEYNIGMAVLINYHNASTGERVMKRSKFFYKPKLKITAEFLEKSLPETVSLT